MRNQATQSLYAYWNEVRRGRTAPRRLEIEPARLGDLLLDAFILECGGRDEFHFRLAGTRVSSRLGGHLKARDFLSCWSEGDRALLAHHLAAVVDLARGGLFTGEASRDGVRVPFELLALPLMHTGSHIDRLLCLFVPLIESPVDPAAPTPVLKLLAAEAVWPNGREDDASVERPMALEPHVRTARIVRQGRRQFRVYEGGRVDVPLDTHEQP